MAKPNTYTDKIRGYFLGAFMGLLCMGACSDHPTLTTTAPEPAPTCRYYECRGCARDHTLDFACTGHEILRAAYRCSVELDLCKANLYGSFCCYPDPAD